MKIFKIEFLEHEEKIKITAISNSYSHTYDYNPDSEKNMLDTACEHIEAAGFGIIGIDEDEDYYYVVAKFND